MEHIVQFGINIDDESIAEAIKRDAKKQVIEQLADEARKALPKKNHYGKEVDWNSLIRDEVDKRVASIVNEKCDEIVELAVKRVYESLTRRKVFRDACKKMDIVFDGIAPADGIEVDGR